MQWQVYLFCMKKWFVHASNSKKGLPWLTLTCDTIDTHGQKLRALLIAHPYNRHGCGGMKRFRSINKIKHQSAMHNANTNMHN